MYNMNARPMTKRRWSFIKVKIGMSVVEMICDIVCIVYIYDGKNDSHRWAVENEQLSWLANCTSASLLFCTFKIIMSCAEACGYDNEVTRCLSDMSLLMSLWAGDVPKSCVNLLILKGNTKKYVNVFHFLKAVFVILFKSAKRGEVSDHHFHECCNCISPAYILGWIVEVVVAVWIVCLCISSRF
ncbi:unnamed protein product [Candidula unifasciata]|uniref:Uncharacterized protein n=1 Tax=Candidula unifasciata TaxID=100452 RepID=A0A8S3YI91_9EUPU|nr:unnamed protein product [Candidula unifasciata]